MDHSTKSQPQYKKISTTGIYEPQYQISTAVQKISTTGIYEPQYQISTVIQKISTAGIYESQYKSNFNRSTIFEPQ